MSRFIPQALVCAALLFAGCKKSGPVGSYEVDKAAMETQLKAQVEKLPPNQKAFGGLMIAMLGAIDIKLELQEGGTFTMTESKMDLKDTKAPPKVKKKEGTWKQEADQVILSAPEEKEDTRCELKSSGLNCSEGQKVLVFKRA